MKVAVAFAALMLVACAAEEPAPDMIVQDAWARATSPGQSSTAVYLAIRNKGGADRLVAVSSPAGRASLHSTSMDGGVMRMRSIKSLDFPAGSTVALEPAGTHVMLTGLTAPLAPGTTVPLKLRFERLGEREVDAAVRPASANGD